MGLALVLVLLGGLFVVLLARSGWRAQQQRHWPQVACEILLSEVESRKHDAFSPEEYRHALLFGYEWQGEALTSARLTVRGSAWTREEAKVRRLVAEWPPGMETTCLVDPSDPHMAVLKPDSLAAGYTVWFPGLFVIGGVGLLIGLAKQKARP